MQLMINTAVAQTKKPLGDLFCSAALSIQADDEQRLAELRRKRRSISVSCMALICVRRVRTRALPAESTGHLSTAPQRGE